MPSWSNASPLLLGDLVVTCAEPGSVIGVSAADGKILWTVTDDPGKPLPKTHQANGYTSATPVSDGQRIFAVFGSGRALAVDRAGKKLWAVDLEMPPHDKWGFCMSPRLASGQLIVHIDQLWGLDPATGATRWQVKTPWTWGTPVIARQGGTEVVWTGGGAAFRASDGKPLASGPPKLEYNSPCITDGVLYYVQTVPLAFALGDAPDAKPRQLWKGAIAKERYYATPLVHDGLLYAVNQRAVLSVLDIKDGTTVYERKLEGLKGTIYPSPTLGGAQIHIGSEGGQTLVLKPGRTYEELARNELEPYRGCPVFSGKRMFLRGQKHLWCIAAP
jgi:outer membrane protein assembly factor BamB